MSDLRFAIINKIQECRDLKQGINVDIAVAHKEYDCINKKQADFELLLFKYDEEHKGIDS